MLSPPGWYPDPGGRHEQRYWDGRTWTVGVADGPVVVEDPLPPPEQARTPLGVRPPETRAQLPLRALKLAGAGLLGAVFAGAAGSAVGALLFNQSLLARLVLGQLGVWA